MDPIIASLPFVTRDMLNFAPGVTFKLHITSQSLATSNLVISGMTRSGAFTFVHATDGLSLPLTEDFGLPDVPIFVTVRDRDAQYWQGDCYVSVDLLLDSDQLYHLSDGFVYGPKTVSFPSVNTNDYRPGGGSILVVTGADPAANTEISDQVPTGQQWIIHAISFQLVTDANGANRTVTLQLYNGAAVVFETPPAAIQIASKTARYSYAPGVNHVNDTTTLSQTIALPAGLLMTGGDSIKTVTTNRQVTDNFGPAKYWVEKLPNAF